MSRRRPPLATAAVLVLLVGWLPLLVYIPFDWLRGGGGNPIGLGLLMVASTAVATLLFAAQVILAIVQRRRRRQEPPS